LNKKRRLEIHEVINVLNDLVSRIGTIQDDEQEYLDNMPENLQSSEKYDAAEEAIDDLESSKVAIEEAVDYLEAAKGED